MAYIKILQIFTKIALQNLPVVYFFNSRSKYPLRNSYLIIIKAFVQTRFHLRTAIPKKVIANLTSKKYRG